jgi:DNA-binding NtrC family response regulator
VSTILVVQPDTLIEERWAEALAHGGHAVLAVRGIADGVARAREGGIDVVVLDALGDDGAVRELVGELERLPDAPPLVLVSASPTAPELSAQIGAAGFLPRPCSSEDLVDLVARVASAAVRHPAFDDETTSPRKKY